MTVESTVTVLATMPSKCICIFTRILQFIWSLFYGRGELLWEKLRHYPQEAKGSAKGQIRTQACLCSTPYLSSTQVWYPIKQQNIPFLHKKIFLPFESQSWQMKTDVTKLFYARYQWLLLRKERGKYLSSIYLFFLYTHTFMPQTHTLTLHTLTLHTHTPLIHTYHTHLHTHALTLHRHTHSSRK